MSDIVVRLQSLAGPSREIDAEIALANGWKAMATSFAAHWAGPDGEIFPDPPRYTESLDAALTLVPEGYGFMLRYHETAAGMRACCSLLGAAGLPDTWDVWGNTPAIALLIAIMKAKEESTP